MHTTIWTDLLIAFGIALLVIAGSVIAKGPKQPENDEFAYLSIAQDLNRTGTFTDGLFKAAPSTIVPGRFFAPLYPLLIHAVSWVSPGTEQSVHCFAGQPNPSTTPCDAEVSAVLFVQIALAAISATCVYAAAGVLAGSRMIAAVAFGLALATGELQFYARSYLTENTALPAFFLFLALAAAAAHRPTYGLLAAAGASLALATLSRPSYLYLLYALIPALAVGAAMPTCRSFGLRWGHLASFVAASIAILAPWSIRNMILFGDPQISSGYGGYILAQRLAYNAMNWNEWAAALVYALPDHGWGMPARLFGSESVVGLGWGPTSYYAIGNGTYMTETLAAAGGREQHLGYLVRHEMLGHLFKHIMVTLPLAERGLWVGKYFGLAAFLLIVPVGLDLARRGRLLPFLAVLLPLMFMAIFHGFVSIGVPRYNVPLLALYGFVMAYVLANLAGRVGLFPLAILRTNIASLRSKGRTAEP